MKLFLSIICVTLFSLPAAATNDTGDSDILNQMTGVQNNVYSPEGDTMKIANPVHGKTIADFYNEAVKDESAFCFDDDRSDEAFRRANETISDKGNIMEVSFFRKKKEEKWYC